MAIKETWDGTIQCITTDTKPTVNIKEGTLCKVFDDTGHTLAKEYRFHNGAWYEEA